MKENTSEDHTVLESKKVLYWNPCYHLTAERLSMRLLILQSVFLVGRVWPQLLSCLKNAIKGVACS